MYKRKTYDEYEVQGRWYGSWELETSESTYKNAKVQLKLYRENQPEVSHRIIKKQIPKSQDQIEHPENYCNICWNRIFDYEVECPFCEGK